MKISTVLNQKGHEIAALAPSATIAAATKELNRNKIGALLVQDENGHLIGILSERDIVFALADMGQIALKLTVADLMTRNVKVCALADEVNSVINLMNRHRIRHVPVVEDGLPVGVISVRDVVASRLDEQNEEAAMYLTMARCRPLSVGLRA